MNEETSHLLFCDGSSLGNPGPGGWGAILVLDHDRVTELGGYAAHTTNNRMELQGLIEGLKRLERETGDLTVFTDSKYVHKGATEWSTGWKKRGWKTLAKEDVGNRDLWEEALALLEQRTKIGHISWTHVPGHSGIAGNERADRIATGFAEGGKPELFEGALGDYAIDILDISIDHEKASKRQGDRSRSRMKAYSYLSLVDGVVKRHATWDECEKRVKGKAGAKYKKSVSPEDEQAILASWGVKL